MTHHYPRIVALGGRSRMCRSAYEEWLFAWCAWLAWWLPR